MSSNIYYLNRNNDRIIDTRTVGIDGVMQPKTAYECLMYYKNRLTPELYSRVCVGILDADEYHHETDDIKTLIDNYFKYNA
ncbi:MAG: hypothetical protein ACO20M_05255 [Methylophilaceae bacterium]